MSETEDLNRLWFALQVKPRHEKTTAWALRMKGFEEFLPLCTSARRWSDRTKELQMPLFPRYVFCRFDLRHKLSILRAPGVTSIVGFGKSPTPVADSEISALQAIVKSGLPAQSWPFLQIGQVVRLQDGPLADLEGILVHFRNRHRLVVSVTILQRSVAVEVDRLWVAPIGRQHCQPARTADSRFAPIVKSA